MDAWQKLEIGSKFVAAVLVPLAIAFAGNQISIANQQKNSETKYVELATAMLSKEPMPGQSEDTMRLREWAVAIIDKYSGVPMSKATAEALIKTTALPSLDGIASGPVDPEPHATWGVVFGGSATLEDAQREATTTAKKMGITDGAVFRRQGAFRSVKIFDNRADAEDALGKARTQSPSSYVVNMAKWCPSSVERKGYFECTAP